MGRAGGRRTGIRATRPGAMGRLCTLGRPKAVNVHSRTYMGQRCTLDQRTVPSVHL